jgi:hypothetical protein
LPTPHDISGLIAWARRPEWRDALTASIERHCAKACAGAGIAPEDIGDTLGEYAASNLFGAAFEDLLATSLPDGSNIADDYLKRRAPGRTARIRLCTVSTRAKQGLPLLECWRTDRRACNLPIFAK